VGGILVLGGIVFKMRRSKKVVVFNQPSGEKVVVQSQGEGECQAGSYVQYGQSRYEIIGKEKHNIGGKAIFLCCGKGYDQKTNRKMKYCYGLGDNKDYLVLWLASDETGGKYRKYMENYPQNGKTCTKIFNEAEEIVMESCQ